MKTFALQILILLLIVMASGAWNCWCVDVTEDPASESFRNAIGADDDTADDDTASPADDDSADDDTAINDDTSDDDTDIDDDTIAGDDDTFSDDDTSNPGR